MMDKTFADVYETALDMYRLGIISEEKMKKIEGLCSSEIPAYSPEKIKELRKNLLLTQDNFAKALNVDVSTVREWEMGKKKPTRWAQRHLHALSSEI